MKFAVGDILELKMDLLFYNMGLTVELLKPTSEDSGIVKIIETNGQDSLLGMEKNADLTLFKLVRRAGLYV